MVLPMGVIIYAFRLCAAPALAPYLLLKKHEVALSSYGSVGDFVDI